MTTTADAVIVGGGVIGASIAYHLASRGVRDIVVLERDQLGSGSTSKNAGGIRMQFSSEINVRLSQRSLPRFEAFPDEMGIDPVFRQVGYLFLITAERPRTHRCAVPWAWGVPRRVVADGHDLPPAERCLDEGATLAEPYGIPIRDGTRRPAEKLQATLVNGADAGLCCDRSMLLNL